MQPIQKRIAKSAKKGVSLTEVLVAATLVLSLIGLLFPMTARVGRVWQSTRHYRLACNELANQMERLTSLPIEQCEAELSTLKPSPELSEALPEVRLSGEIIRDQDGTRLLLRLDWSHGVNTVPLTLVGWFDTEPIQSVTTQNTLSGKESNHAT